MTEKQEQIIKIGLRNGIGFSRVCYANHYSIKKLSKFLRENPLKFQELIDECETGFNAILITANNEAAAKKIKQSISTKKHLDDFVHEVNLWESYVTHAKLTHYDLVCAFRIYKFKEEVATVCGMNYAQLMQQLADWPTVRENLLNEGFKSKYIDGA